MSARRGLRPRLGCALGAGLRSLGRLPIVGPPPGMADAVVGRTVTDTIAGTVSDAAGKAVATGVAGQAPPEPYVPGSGDRLPAELRLVLAGYAGIACGLSAGALACAAAAVFSSSSPTSSTGTTVCTTCCSAWPSWRFSGLCGGSAGLEALKTGNRFSQAAPAAQRSTHGHGDGLEAWRTHADT